MHTETAATDDYADHDEPPSRPTGLRDAKREAEAAYQEYVRIFDSTPTKAVGHD